MAGRGRGRRPRTPNPVAARQQPRRGRAAPQEPVVRGPRRRQNGPVVENDQPTQRRRLNQQRPEPANPEPEPEPEPELVPPALGEVDDNNEPHIEEPLMVPGFNDTDIFISQKLKEKIWNFEYIDLSLLLHNNLNNQNTEDTLAFNNGSLVIQKRTKNVHSIKSISDWTDAFIAYSQVMIENHPDKSSELFSYISIIRGAAREHSFE